MPCLLLRLACTFQKEFLLMSLENQLKVGLVCIEILGKKKSFAINMYNAVYTDVDLGGLVVSVLATGPKVKDDKNPEHHFLRRGSKAVGPMS
jgi:hypothetical protein